MVLLIIDNVQDEKNSIINLQSVNYINGQISLTKYLDDFPFLYYSIIVKNLQSLPEIISSVVRQWFELLSSK